MPLDDLVTTVQPRDEKGKFGPKRPLEFTWPHFWLEVAEIAVGILIAQALWEGGVLLLPWIKGLL